MKTLISNALLVDGSGAPPFRGGLLFDENCILKIVQENEKYEADRIIDGTDLYLAPGFIDLHSHSDLSALDASLLQPKVAQGITTEVCGVCGLGVAPMSFDLQEDFRQQSIIGKGAIPWPWEKFSEYLANLNQQGLSRRLIPFVGHGVLRYHVAKNRPGKLTQVELDQMCRLLQESFDQGAKGLSLGLIYLPALYADRDELQAIIRIAAKNNKMVMVHLRSESDGIVEAICEVADICQQEGAKLHLSHLKIIGQKNEYKIDRIFELLEKYDLSFDHYPYSFGSTTLFSLLPPWMIKGESPREILTSLQNKREELRLIYSGKTDLSSYFSWGWDNLPFLCGWENIVVTSLKDNHPGVEVGKSLKQLAQEWQCDETNALLTLLLREEGQVMMIDTYMREELLKKIMQHPRGLFGTDALFNSNPHPRVFDAYPKILREYVLEKKWLTLEEAIAKMTGRSATLMGLTDRGFLCEGMRSDLVLFNNFGEIQNIFLSKS